MDQIRKIIEDSISVKRGIINEEFLSKITKAGEVLSNAVNTGNKILVCGNGGSASQAMHMAGELICRFEKIREGIPCIALGTNPSALTAWANDAAYEFIFEREVESLGQKDDVLIAISTSGNSSNILNAIKKARNNNMKIISLLGKDGGKQKDMADLDLIVKGMNTARIQETHILIIHILCKLIEENIRDKNGN